MADRKPPESIYSSLLSPGAIKALLGNNGILAKPAIFQLTKFKMIPQPESSGNYASISLFDGSQVHNFFFSSTLNDQIIRDEFVLRYHTHYTEKQMGDILLIKQTKFATNFTSHNGTSVVVIEEYDLLATKVPLLNGPVSESPGLLEFPSTLQKATLPTTPTGSLPNSPKTPSINLITDGFNWLQKWKIRGKCVEKERLRDIKNGTDKAFNFVMEDETGRIRITGFGKTAEKAFSLVQLNSSYFLTGMLVRRNDNTTFNRTGHPFEIRLYCNFEVVPCEDVKTKQVLAKFEPSSLDLTGKHKGDILDVLAIVQKISPIENFVGANENPWTLRKINLMDKHEFVAVLTFWGDEARHFDEHAEGKIIKIKSACVKEYKGKLSLGISSGMSKWELSPDLRDATELHKWYHNEYLKNRASNGVSNKNELGPDPTRFNVCPLDEIHQKGNGVFDVLAVVHEIHPLVNKLSKKTKKPYTNRKISLIDKSESLTTFTLWDYEARHFDELRLDLSYPSKEAGLKSLKGTTKWELSPEIPEATALLDWYYNEYSDLTTIEDILKEGDKLIDTEFKVKAKVHSIDIDEWHRACRDCNRKIPKKNVLREKVQEHTYKLFKCDHCEAKNTMFKWDYKAEVELADGTKSFTAIAFDRIMKIVLGKSADEIGEFMEVNDEPYRRLEKEAKSKEFIWKIKAKAGHHLRIRETVYEVKDVQQIGGSKRTEADVYHGKSLAEALKDI